MITNGTPSNMPIVKRYSVEK